MPETAKARADRALQDALVRLRAEQEARKILDVERARHDHNADKVRRIMREPAPVQPRFDVVAEQEVAAGIIRSALAAEAFMGRRRTGDPTYVPPKPGIRRPPGADAVARMDARQDGPPNDGMIRSAADAVAAARRMRGRP